jgi:hypothetical protein
VIAQSLLARGHGHPWWVAAYLGGLALISMLAALFTPDTRPAVTDHRRLPLPDGLGRDAAGDRTAAGAGFSQS